jgi:hypothetical protein
LAAGVRPKDQTAASGRLSAAVAGGCVTLTHLAVEDRTAPATCDNPARDHARHLPDDVAALRALVLTAWAERDAQRAENGRLIEERDQLAGQNDRLRHLLRQLQRMQFGRPSEKLDPDQFNLALEDVE